MRYSRRCGRTGTRCLSKLRTAPPAGGRYENGWNGREILAHVASIEWTYRNLVEIARQARDADPALVRADGSGLPTREMRGGNDAYNARQVEKRARATVPELIDEWERNREMTLAAVEDADEALFAVEIRSAGGVPGALGDVLLAVTIGHVNGHVDDIVRGE
ncbi:MAG: DinB family protein [Tepidiformaceae bacterium]